ncbi:hypothetical protein ETAA8_17950 [Anatilimnocola aggregata]|uniref:Uncharacterized protein n=1 Tax=Anatilimnocola aggregata TaxID=2528021 RepID=A0A517Y8Z8_9BACT|nr:hypothetical protein ETAA8_17950 [Anatilimnocola aggregata]
MEFSLYHAGFALVEKSNRRGIDSEILIDSQSERCHCTSSTMHVSQSLL